MNSQYIQKNVAFVVGALRTAVLVENNIELSRLALLMPLLMDDRIVSVVNDSALKHSFESLITTNRIPLANYNERYLSSLPYLYQAVAMLLDVEVVSMKNGVLTKLNTNILSDMCASCQCQSLTNMCKAMQKLLKMTEGKSIVKMYELLNVEL